MKRNGRAILISDATPTARVSLHTERKSRRGVSIYGNTFEDNFWAKVDASAKCWLWTGWKNAKGYGMFSFNGKSVLAHRFIYRFVIGDIPNNLVIDHLCRVRNCVNPEHMEAVTNGENVLRGIGNAAKNLTKTSCPKGHPYSGNNLMIETCGGRRGIRSYRRCRLCVNLKSGRV